MDWECGERGDRGRGNEEGVQEGVRSSTAERRRHGRTCTRRRRTEQTRRARDKYGALSLHVWRLGMNDRCEVEEDR